MFVKTVLVVFTCSSLILGLRIDPRVRRQEIEDALDTTETSGTSSVPNAKDTSESPSSSRKLDILGLPSIFGDGKKSESRGLLPSILTNPGKEIGSGIEKGIERGLSQGLTNGLTGAASVVTAGIEQGISKIINRFTNAANETYIEESNSVINSYNTLKNLLHDHIETGKNITKTAFDLGSIIPKYVKNVIAG